MSIDGEVIKTDFMVKRSQMRGIFKNENYRSRWFVLTTNVLRYHEGALETSPGKEKGRIPLVDVRAVEEVDSDALGNKANAFQVVYQDTAARDVFVLYIVAVHTGQRKEWMELIREESEKCGAKFDKKYHCGVYNVRQRTYTCCSSIDRYCPGCCPTTFSPNQKDSPPVGRNDRSSSATSDNNHRAVSRTESTPAKRSLPSLPSPSVNKPKPQVPDTQKKIAVALYDYTKADSGDLCLKKGEQYEILDDSNENWWLAKSIRTAEQGYVPSNYVQEKTETGIETYDWYYRNTTRLSSEDILKGDGRDGTFLVRDSSQAGMYTLSILTHDSPQGSGVVRHYHIKKNSKKLYYLSDNHAFENIPDLIFYHKHNSAGLIVRLRSPPQSQADQPPTAGFGHDINEINRDDLQMMEHLGSGQFGTVKKALYKPNNKEVAVKMMQANAMSEDDFVLEATTMQQLTHPNLVQLYGVCSAAPIYIVTEFMKHGALLQYLRRHKTRLLEQPGKLLDMCVQVCSAMKYLESHQFLHRDLAARNCLVGDNNVIKVGDFGLARFVLDDDYTSSSGTKFPIKWAAPEVLQYTRFSSKSDVWAYGVLMWEIFSGGEMPYRGVKNPDVISLVVTQKKRLDCPRLCPSAIYDVMLKCWKAALQIKKPFHQIVPSLFLDPYTKKALLKDLADHRPPFKDLYDDLLTLQEEREYVG